MQKFITRVGCAALALVLVALTAGIISGGASSRATNEASSALAAPGATPTYVSQLAPAVSRPPQTAGLPFTGTGAGESLPWTPIAGAALSVLGAGLIHAGLLTRKPAIR